jgi:hypothetical protein
VTPAGVEERAAPRGLRVDEVAREEDAVEAPAEVELLDVRHNRLGAANVREHLGRLVDRGHAKAEPDELPRDPAGAAAELQHRGPCGKHRRDDLALAQLGQPHVDPHWAAVRRGSHSRGA